MFIQQYSHLKRQETNRGKKRIVCCCSAACLDLLPTLADLLLLNSGQKQPAAGITVGGYCLEVMALGGRDSSVGSGPVHSDGF